MDDDHDHKFSVTAMTVQVFTIPTIARFLVKEEGALEMIVKYQHQFLQKYTQTGKRNLPLLDFTATPMPTVLERALYSMHDLHYFLSSFPKAQDWDEKLSEAYLKGVSAFLRFMRDFQHMDETRRYFSEHQMNESEWESAFQIWYRVLDTIFCFANWPMTSVG